MGLIETELNPSDATKRLLTDSLSGWYNSTRAMLANCALLVWKNPHGLTPQEVFDLIGPEGVKLLAIAQSVGKSLTDAVPDKPVEVFTPADLEAKQNVDGTVTIAAAKVVKVG